MTSKNGSPWSYAAYNPDPTCTLYFPHTPQTPRDRAFFPLPFLPCGVELLAKVTSQLPSFLLPPPISGSLLTEKWGWRGAKLPRFLSLPFSIGQCLEASPRRDQKVSQVSLEAMPTIYTVTCRRVRLSWLPAQPKQMKIATIYF